MSSKLQRRQRVRQVEPDDDETYSDFMDRCVDELGDEDVCQMIWDERAGDGEVIRKTHASKTNGMEFVLSDETPDRMDDVIMSDGWQLDNFRKNPIALFGHRSDFPIGTWKDLRVEKKQLIGRLDIAPEGTSERIDEIRRLIDAGILRAVSVGFKPIETKPRKETDWGVFYTKAELVETSVVSVPANPNALAIAKSMKISAATIDLVFAGQGTKGDLGRRSFNGGQASRKSDDKRRPTMSLAQRIVDAEKRLVELRDKLSAHFDNVDDTNVSDQQLETANELNAKITQEEKNLAALREAEKHLAGTADVSNHSVVVRQQQQPERPAAPALSRPFSIAPKKLEPMDFLVRAGTVQLFAHLLRKPVDEVRRTIYGDDEATKAVLEWSIKAASTPATTFTPGWAQELVQQIVVDFMALLMPKSIFPRLSGYGLSLSFGRNGKIVIPTRARTPTIAGSFVGEGQPIPVRQGAFASQTLVPKKMAVITTWTREIDEHSVPAVEGLLRNAIQEDTAVSLDSVLLDSNPATSVRPAGLLSGVASLPPTAGGGFAALVGDIKQITGALLTGTLGNVRSPAWLMNPQQINSAGLTTAPGVGAFPFRTEIDQGRLSGWPIIDSGTVPMGTVIAVDAADFVAVGGDAPRFEISDQATLHMEDTAPADIVSGAAPGTPANPVKSMWQTDSLALRLILPVNWALRRSGVVAWVQGVTW
ncbi:HK97 family phage prohead protease [Bradyrhizobium barranii subsp. barranii]|uniref:phage major capsid protein n=1 Tax=Bradyrhizobium liaoningense TaxID=43992 RepID=UPI001BAA1B28|nr:phage major capsid protein [Bradyrhizobium liaoningense]MBR0879118.1 phage major capsid protein [Bradyrhizobium liaoningense]